MTNRTKYEFDKDRFRAGEYSIYLRSYTDNEVRSESYVFGVSKKYEAEAACAYLNELLAKRCGK